jgi:hypothetical protein
MESNDGILDASFDLVRAAGVPSGSLHLDRPQTPPPHSEDEQ